MALKCCNRRRISSDVYETVSQEDAKKRPLWQRIMIWTIGIILTLILLIFILIWVVIPLVFMNSIAFQRYMLFMPFQNPKDPQFNNPEYYGIKGAVNFYITVTDLDNKTLTSIGAWLIKPDDEMGNNSTNVSEIISNTKKDVLLYLHGVACNRCKQIKQYEVFRKFWLVIAIDHRGYGDSGQNVEMSEDGIVNDHLQIYDWVRQKTKNDIYYWGHSLGAALTCHTVRELKEQKAVVPKGVTLESAFTTMREEIINIIIGKIFSWLAYFQQTVLDPVEYNGFKFRNVENVKYIDSPIMQLHAEDDNVIPLQLGKQLYRVANNSRRSDQGRVIFHVVPPVGWKHDMIVYDPDVPKFIEDFTNVCKNFTARRKMRRKIIK